MPEKRKGTEEWDQLASTAAVSLVECVGLVDDPRGRQGVRHVFSDILTILVLATVCGCDDAEAVEEWGLKEERWLRTFLRLPYGIPAQDSYLRALASMNPKAFRSAFRQWAQRLFQLLGVEGQIAIDGKTMRGARQTNQSKSAVHIVSALACEYGVVVGQIRTEEKSNEITAMPELLRLLSLKGALVSADAMGCQVEIAQTIIEQQGDYLFGLKGNQPTLNTEVAELFNEADDPRRRAVDEAPRPKVEQDEQVDSGHGRIETRRATVCHEFEGWVPSARRFPSLKTLVRVAATVEDNVTGKVTTEHRYYISSREMTAAAANAAVRAHWSVENGLHWCLDVTFGEDGCRIRTGHAAENLTVVRHFALSLLRSYTGDRLSIRRRRRRCDYYMDYRLKVLAASVG
jgi:predicted transposase YbfD/YdcC